MFGSVLFKKPNYEITVTVFQALLLLAEKYQSDPLNRGKYETIKSLCLSGVRSSEDERVLEELLTDRALSQYRISSRVRDVNQDPVRRYFESQLCHKTLITSLDLLDMGLLKQYVNSAVDRLPLVYQAGVLQAISAQDVCSMDKYSEGMFVLTRSDSYQAFKPNVASGRSSPEETLDIRKEKMHLLASSMYLARKNLEIWGSRGTLAALHSQEKGPYDPKIRQRKRKLEQNGHSQQVVSDRMGIMSSSMPLPLNDELLAERTSDYTRSVDKFSCVNVGLKESLKLDQVSPFVGGISGTILIHFSMIAELLKAQHFVYQKDLEQRKLFLQSYIAYMLYQAGGHSLDEYMRVLKLPEVQERLRGLPDFLGFTLDSLFRKGNEVAFEAALGRAMTYNQRILSGKRVNEELVARERKLKRPGYLGELSFFGLDKINRISVVNQSNWTYLPLFLLICLLDDKRLSEKKDHSIFHLITCFVNISLMAMFAEIVGAKVISETERYRP